ncbi:MAG TPA: energy transducer TonB [Thermoanaerobaculia bacterium]
MRTRSRLLIALGMVWTLSCASGVPVKSTLGRCAADAEPAALKVKTGSGIVPPKVMHRVEPTMPASLSGQAAVATIQAIIGEDGMPRHICISAGNEEWGRQVAEALRYWRFQPATLDGKPVAVQFELTTRLTPRNWS